MKEIVSGLAEELELDGKSDAEKVRIVHDYLCRSTSLDDRSASGSGHKGREWMANHSILGVFANNLATSEGISMAFYLLMSAAGIDSMVVRGKAVYDAGAPKREHQWNIVEVDGKTYHVDVSLDIRGSIRDARCAVSGEGKHICYDYYCLTDKDIQKDHDAEYSGAFRCGCDDINYFKTTRTEFYSSGALVNWLSGEVAAGKTDLYFRYKGDQKMEELMDQLMTQVDKQLSSMGRDDNIIYDMNELQKTGRIMIVEGE